MPQIVCVEAQFRPSPIMQDLRDLKAKFPHVGEETIKQTYAEVFRDIARNARNRAFLYLLAKRFTAERLQNEHPAERKTVNDGTDRKEQKGARANNAFFRFFRQAFTKDAEPAG